ncbi:putative sporulation protein YtxC [Caloramator fervidus]|uniref:Putative sporulation protein YtxC n=1 Tax=Caloramator fervidus TaxID=29344 RepID=A0A1H5U7E6_9CLOT|nr:putative sporulation protein YtxC [Caloramator fervidus]SEF70899.1 putative sporulation protein YtxC [Caloramator fervidus]
MLLLSIGFNREKDEIYDRFNELCSYLRGNDINVAMVENDIGDYHYIKFVLKDSEKDIRNFEIYRDAFISYASDIIYDYIMKNYEIDILNELIKENCSYFSKEDILKIKNKCISFILGNGTMTAEDILNSMRHRNAIYKKIEEFLQENREIIIDGFVKFRLKFIKEDINGILEKMIEEYMLEKEYDEFIKLLRYFVEIQESKYEVLNIYINSSGEYILKDGDFKDVTKELFLDFENFNISGETTLDDILLSVIVTCAPKRVVIHLVENCKNKEIIETIKNIFIDRIYFCNSCEDCNIIKGDNKLLTT